MGVKTPDGWGDDAVAVVGFGMENHSPVDAIITVDAEEMGDPA